MAAILRYRPARFGAFGRVLAAAANVAAARTSLGFARSTWTPTITASSGTFTSVTGASGSYIKFERLVVFRAAWTVATVGTAAAQMRFTLPFDAAGNWSFSGINATTGVALIGYTGSPDASQALVVSYDGTSAIATNSYIVSGSYESTS